METNNRFGSKTQGRGLGRVDRSGSPIRHTAVRGYPTWEKQCECIHISSHYVHPPSLPPNAPSLWCQTMRHAMAASLLLAVAPAFAREMMEAATAKKSLEKISQLKSLNMQVSCSAHRRGGGGGGSAALDPSDDACVILRRP